MKTILLTSAGMNMKEEILKILPKPAEQIKLAHITTASKVEADTSWVQDEVDEMEKLGFQVEEIDIADMSEDALRGALTDKDIVYVQGGNTFYLLKHVRESGFDTIIKELIEKGVIYVGVSAGSIIAGPTIETAAWKAEYADPNDVNLTDLTGMNLVDFNVFVHYAEKYKESVATESTKSNYPVKILTDEQAILIRDGKVEFLENKK